MRGLKLEIGLEEVISVIVAPYTGAWIETRLNSETDIDVESHPTRVRGLKQIPCLYRVWWPCRTLHGCVD